MSVDSRVGRNLRFITHSAKMIAWLIGFVSVRVGAMWFVVQRKQSAEPQARSTLPENPAEPSKVLQVFKQHWAGSAKIERWFELPIKVLNDFFEGKQK